MKNGRRLLVPVLLRRAASAPKSPFITKSSIRVTVQFLAVAVGEGRVEEGSRCTAVPSELTLLEQGLPALEACDDNVHDKGAFVDDSHIQPASTPSLV